MLCPPRFRRPRAQLQPYAVGEAGYLGSVSKIAHDVDLCLRYRTIVLSVS